MNPYFETKIGKLYHGDCLEIMPKIESVHLVLTDIPYGEVNRSSNGLRNLDKHEADIETFCLGEFVRAINYVCLGSLYVFCGTEQVSEIRSILVNKGLSTRLGFWEKTNPSPMNGEYLWLSGVECFVFAKNSGATFNEKCKTPVFRYPTARNQIHYTQKPTILFQRIVLASSLEYDMVLDPCFGSGTTAIVCERLNRRWIGIEISEEYCEISARRIEKEISQRRIPGF